MQNSRISPFAGCLSTLLLTLVGCGEGEQITTYPVPQASAGDAGDAPLPVAGQSDRMPGMRPAGDAAASPSRMLVAMAEQGPQTWFFKLLGPVKAVEQHEDEFDEFIRSLKFSNGKPNWSVPSGWNPQGQSGLRLETFHVGNHQPQLELTVIPLGTMAGGGDRAILDNLNRWRGQLQLKPLGSDALAKNIERVKVRSGAEVVVMDISGGSSSNRGGQPPFAGRPMTKRGTDGGATAAGPPVGSSSSNDSSPITYDTPKGWIPGKTSAFRKAAFDITDGDRKALVTVIPLPQSGTLANINRWRGQVGLGEITQDELDKDLKPVTVDGIKGQMAEMVGKDKTILAAIVNRGERAWFFKLQGDVELARREKERFESFVKSVKFK